LSRACWSSLLWASPPECFGEELVVKVRALGLYRIVDGEAELWVASESGVPRKGTRVIVAGRIYDAYDVRGLPLPLPSSVANGVLLLESSRATE
jgi:hypothetical protein